ncbi:MAG: purine-nucleoside phosphorylase [Bacilli bacterium]
MIETPHIKALKEDFAKTVIMPGDPLRAKFIAQTYLEDYKLINSVRGILGYTGYYKRTRVTVMASGMGMPSMGIYCYELYHFFDVERIIRIGSAGTFNKDVHVLDVVLADNVYTEGNFAYNFNNEDCHLVGANKQLNNKIIEVSKKINKSLKLGNTLCAECFDSYLPHPEELLKRIPTHLNIIAMEMEAFSLFYIAKYLNKEASCLVTISDSMVEDKVISTDDRQTSLTDMIEIALETVRELSHE